MSVLMFKAVTDDLVVVCWPLVVLFRVETLGAFGILLARLPVER